MKKKTYLKRFTMIASCFLFLTLQTQKAGARVKKVLTAKDTIQYIDLTEIFRSNLTNQANIDKEWDDIHSIATLQGIVNRDKPQLFIKIQNSDSYWWGIYRCPGAWLSKATVRIQPSVIDVIRYFKNKINGVVLYDPKVPSTSNVASSIAGIENLMAVRYDTSSNSLYRQVVLNGPKLAVKRRLINEDGSSLFTGKGTIPGTGIVSSGSVKNDPYLWFMELYMKTGKCNTEYGAYYLDQYWRKNPNGGNQHTLSNHDFFVSRKGFFFDLSPWGDEAATDDANQLAGTDLSTMKKFLMVAYNQNKGRKMCYIGGFPSWAYKYTKHAGGKHGDVETEWKYSEIISSYNAFMDADALGLGTLANASFWQHFPLNDNYPQKWAAKKDLIQRGYLNPDGSINYKGRKFVLFYVGDYDASSWVAGAAPDLWSDSNRGKVPLMWSISPVLQERVPHAMHYFRTTASSSDYFAAADNGAGYLNPGMLQAPRSISGLPDGLNTWAEHCKKYYKKWGISLTGFIIDGNAPGLNNAGLDCYASFSPDGIVPQKTGDYVSLHSNMPVLRAGSDINDADPSVAANSIIRMLNNNNSVPFHWFRAILKSPSWYLAVSSKLKSSNIECLDAPTFFELLRYYVNPQYHGH